MRRVLTIVLCLSLLGLSLASAAAKPRQAALLVAAAADLAPAFQEIGALFEQATGMKVVFNFGSTGQLAQQIERGAPVDLFAAASMASIDVLERQGLIIPNTKKPYARGRLMLWSRSDSLLRLTQLEDLAHPDVRRVAMANPAHAPYGVAARDALQSIGIWEQVQPKLVLGEHVQQAFQYAARGNVDAALVALSLSTQQQGGRWTLIAEALHQPIVQVLAVLKRTQHEGRARQFVAFIHGAQGRAILRKYGFSLPTEDTRP